MIYNPERHKRKSIRLKEYDYSKNGAYFVTICTSNRDMLFEEYEPLKIIVNNEWNCLENNYSNIVLDEFVIMPNHIHGIIFIVGEVERVKAEDSGAGCEERVGARPTRTSLSLSAGSLALGDIIGAFKSKCVVEWLKYIKSNNLYINAKFWHRNYYERIIRDERGLNNVRQYIINNPINWKKDKLNKISDNRNTL